MASAASAASAASVASAASDPEATLANLEEQIDNIKLRIQLNELKILQEETKIKDILRECGQDEKKKERRKDELLELLKKKKRLQTLNDQQEGLQQSLKKSHFELLKTMRERDWPLNMKKNTKRRAPNVCKI